MARTKVTILKNAKYIMDEVYCRFYYCPKCGQNELRRSFKYCPICGALLEWEE